MRNRQVRGENVTNEKQLQWAKKCKRFVLYRGTLINLLPNGDTQICVTRSRGAKLIAATHNGKGKHLTLPMTKQLICFSPYWWPKIDKDIKYHAEYECGECMLKLGVRQEEMNLKDKQTTTLKEMSPSDWRKPYVEYLLFGNVISNDLTGEEKERIANRSQFFIITNGKVMRQFVANEIPKECISKNRIQGFLNELQEKYQICEEIIKQATQGPYWWPTMTRDIQSFIKQRNGTISTQQKNESNKADWRTLIVDYLSHGTTGDRYPFEQENGTYFMKEGELRKDVNQEESKICIAEDQINHLKKRYMSKMVIISTYIVHLLKPSLI